MFLGKNEHDEYILDLNEPKPEPWELLRAEELLMIRERSQKREMTYPGECVHVDMPCRSRRECQGKVAWWRRYLRQIEFGESA